MSGADDPEAFPLQGLLGMAVEDLAEGSGRTVIDVAERHLNPNGVVHGAVLFAMVDTAMGKATMSMLGEGQHCASVDIQMRFIRAVGDGRVVADAKVLRRGRTVVHLQAGVTDDEDHLIATAEGTFTIIVP